MIREICKDEKFLAQKAEQATPDDIQTATDLLETLEAHKDGCVGMAANMIGVNKRIIAFDNEGTYMVMFNPQIVKQSGGYEAEEGCLSLTGTRKTRRWQSIKVQYQNEKFQTRLKNLHRLDCTDYPARNRPLQRHHYLRKKQKCKPAHTKRHAKRCAFSCRSRKRRQRRTAVRRFNSLKSPALPPGPSTAAAARHGLVRCADEISPEVSPELPGYLGDGVPLRRRFSPAARVISRPERTWKCRWNTL